MFVYGVPSVVLVTTMAFVVCTTVKISVTAFTDLEGFFAGIRVYEPLKSVVPAAFAIVNDSDRTKTKR